MWNGKKKAVTFSFDDGVLQDARLINILDKYGLKATFNLNAGKFGTKWPYEVNGTTIERTLIEPWQVKELYKNHEVAGHTVGHFKLTELSDACITWQVEEDRILLEKLTGKDVCCMAYPCGDVDDRVVNVIKNTSSIRLARTVISTYSFDMQDSLLLFHPTIHFRDEKLFELTERFIALTTKEPKMFYIWGHAYELDAMDDAWERFERFCRLISKREDIFYGTNKEVCLFDDNR